MHVAQVTYLTSSELAERLRRSPRTLANWRTRGGGPRYMTLGARVMYRLDDVIEWEDSARERDAELQAERAQRNRERLDRLAREGHVTPARRTRAQRQASDRRRGVRV
ncbi:helix-turn-helix domain-containing protein [Mycobacteroides abscessus subsp. abscessus]|uniref:helix-turn-helix transcriptional regulator n=1 Tax=Mycobacteroides abscessus TaxID=36809 RepID=UPI000E684FBE|nr:helix-turn-helix domain-containing protein [Mycobacteroides abscessus]MBN7484535.1 helix-turn-helix domain-containing protein [Mycobacteroides abscessus subsp. abscessus]MDO3240524.1 helix-turn-helix domain-containing protein [Mycobacteroides abscessus subsp. abscessus]RIT75018.1 DNA-binding protein [Mycobacteroides abscessus]